MLPAMLTTILTTMLTIVAGLLYCIAMFLLGFVLTAWYLDDKRK